MRFLFAGLSLVLALMFTNGSMNAVQAQTAVQSGQKKTPPRHLQTPSTPYNQPYPYYQPPQYVRPNHYVPRQYIPPAYYWNGHYRPLYWYPNQYPQYSPYWNYQITIPAQPPIYSLPVYAPPLSRPPAQQPLIEWPRFPREPQGEMCGGMMGATCSNPNDYCHMEQSAQCGAADQSGVCRTRPQICTQEYAPICGCDGRTYATACTANSNGVSAAHSGQCR